MTWDHATERGWHPGTRGPKEADLEASWDPENPKLGLARPLVLLVTGWGQVGNEPSRGESKVEPSAG